MDWKYYIPHQWNKPTAVWEDIWLWPVGTKIDGNMGNKINLAIDALGSLLEDCNSRIVEIARRLKSDEKPYCPRKK